MNEGNNVYIPYFPVPKAFFVPMVSLETTGFCVIQLKSKILLYKEDSMKSFDIRY